MCYEDYDNIDLSPRDYGWVHEDELPDLEFGKSMMESLINSVYETGDVELLEDCLDELATLFNLRLPDKNPRIEKKKSTRPYQIPLAI